LFTRSVPLMLFSAIFAMAAPLYALEPPAPAPARTTPAPAQIRLEMHLTRIEKESPTGANPEAGATGPTESNKPAIPASPAVASPTLMTLDRGTATVAVTNKDLSYSISVSPAIEQKEKSDSTVQILWNVRLSGRALPEGTNAVTTTGATRITPDAESETLLTEIPISDVKTGKVSVFRLTVRVAVTKAASSGPAVGPVPATAPIAP
jgi:hypothetical protein